MTLILMDPGVHMYTYQKCSMAMHGDIRMLLICYSYGLAIWTIQLIATRVSFCDV